MDLPTSPKAWAEHVCSRLNAMRRYAPEILERICKSRWPCDSSVESADCPAVPYCSDNPDDVTSGMLLLGGLGVINGLMFDNYRIVAHYADNEFANLTHFAVMTVEELRRLP